MKKIKRAFKKLKYLDKTQSSYFAIMTFIATFCMFTGVTYSYFTLTEHLNAATLTIAKLNYELTSTDTDYNDGVITVPANTTKTLTLSLKSLNRLETKYALNYETTNPNVKVYYKGDNIQNTEGIIGSTNSIIDITIVIENVSNESATITLNTDCGYLQNTLTSNITEEFRFDVPKAVLAIENNQRPAGVQLGTPDFSQTATTDEGVYASEDDYGVSYYYRGAVENNYIYYAGYYWRIIRVNGDGSLRIIYDGTSAHANGENSIDRIALPDIAWNTTNYNDAKYVGYMYGGNNGEASTSKEQAQTNETPSNMKIKLENWYKEKIVDQGFSSAVADKIFCNDRSTPESSNSLGYGNIETHYGAYIRLINNKTPNYKCEQNNDKFTTNTNTGNGALTYPVGLITADEVAMAGAVWNNTNTNYYLYKGSTYWFFTPFDFDGNYAHIFNLYNNNGFHNSYVISSFNVAPVINLNAEYAKNLSGDGTKENPYREGFSLQDGLKALGKKQMPKNVNTAAPNFLTTSTTNEGVFALDDDYTESTGNKSLYYRGAVTNNYVKFAGFYWRIIRINGDGTVRLIYDGTSAHANGESSEDRVAATGVQWNYDPLTDENYNYNDNDNKYLGYMYGGLNGEASASEIQAQTNETDSNIKTKLDKWYEKNLYQYKSQIADSIFCNDRRVFHISTNDRMNEGWGNNKTQYKASRYLSTRPDGTIDEPITFICEEKNDRFTVNSGIGNMALKYPIGLINASESIAAGSTSDENTNYYLYKGIPYWVMSPFIMNRRAQNYILSDKLFRDVVSSTNNSLVPVINLTNEYAKKLTGTGTINDPYFFLIPPDNPEPLIP